MFRKAKIKSRFRAKSLGYGVIIDGKRFSKSIHKPAVDTKRNINHDLNFLVSDNTATLK